METSLSSLLLKNLGGLSLQSSLNRTDNKAEANKAGFTNGIGNNHGNTINPEEKGLSVSKAAGSQSKGFDQYF